MALIASQYLDTSTEHAEAMLATAEQLAAGLGAQPKGSNSNAPGGPLTPSRTPSKSSLPSHSESSHSDVLPGTSKAAPTPKKTADGIGNAALRLWIGERRAELKRRIGDEEGARVQEELNGKVRGVVKRIEGRSVGVGGLRTPVKDLKEGRTPGRR